MIGNGSQSTLKDFDTLGKLGQGSFGVVYKVKRRQDNVVYVMKQINISKMNSRMKADAINEVHILSKLNNPYVVKYYDSFIDKNLLCIIMEFCDGGDLSSYLKSQQNRPLQELRIWRFFILSAMGLDYIHRKKILHRDIKAMNIFLTRDDGLRIGDLGVAKVLSEQANFAHTMVGTPFYLSPEMCEEKPYNEKSDIWSLGCVLYELCTFRHPFEASNQGALVLRIIRGTYSPIPSIYSKDLSTIVDMCLCRDYKKRPHARDILATSIIKGKATQLNIELDYSKTKSNDGQYKNKKDEKPNVAAQSETNSSAANPALLARNAIDKQKEKNNIVLNAAGGRVVSRSPTSRDIPIAGKKLADEKDLKSKVEAKLQAAMQMNQQKEDRRQKELQQEMLKKEELRQNAIRMEAERQKQKDAIFKKQKEREDKIRQADEERKAAEIKRLEQLKKADKPKVGGKDPSVPQTPVVAGKDVKSKVGGINDRSPVRSSVALPSGAAGVGEKKKQLFGAQDNSNDIILVPVTPSRQNLFGVGVQKKSVAEINVMPQGIQDSRSQAGIKKNQTPITSVANLQKNPFGQPAKVFSSQRDSVDQLAVRKEVMNLPDRVNIVVKDSAGSKAAQPGKPTISDLRNIAALGENDSSSIGSTSTKTSKQSGGQIKGDSQQLMMAAMMANAQQRVPSDESFGSDGEDEERGDKVGKLAGKQVVGAVVSGGKKNDDKLRKQIQSSQQRVDDDFIDAEFKSSDDEQEQAQQKNKKQQQQPSSQFEFISIPKPKELNPWTASPALLRKKDELDARQRYNREDDDEDDYRDENEKRANRNYNQNYGNESEERKEVEEEEQQQYYNNNGSDGSTSPRNLDEELQSVSSDNDDDFDGEDGEEEDEEEEVVESSGVVPEMRASRIRDRETRIKELEKKLASEEKRQAELNTLLSIKVNECHKVIGVEKFKNILSFFKDVLNQEEDLSKEDQEEIDSMIHKNLSNVSNQQVIGNFYKILFLEMELEKHKENISNLVQKINSMIL